MNGCDSECQPSLIDPIALGNDSMGGFCPVGMGVHEPGQNNLSRHINYSSFFGNLYSGARPDGLNTVAIDQNTAVFNNASGPHGDDSGSN